MTLTKKRPVLIIAEDDPEDQLLTEDALEISRFKDQYQFVNNGEELMSYLRDCMKQSQSSEDCPKLILLDLNMPKMDGREALKNIKKDPVLRSIPVVVLTTSWAEEDIQKSYEMGVNSYITKPVSQDEMQKLISTLEKYWFELVRLPNIKWN